MPRKPTGNPPGRPKPAAPTDPSVKPELPEWCWRAIAVEAEAYEIGREPWPSAAAIKQVARDTGVTPRAVRQRRLDPLYRAALEWYFRQLILTGLEARAERRDRARARLAGRKSSFWEARTRDKWAKLDDAARGLWVERWVKRNWIEGASQRSPLIENHLCTTWQEYAAHMLEAGYLPAPDPFDGT